MRLIIALPLRRCDFVADALARDLALELRERQQHVQGHCHVAREVAFLCERLTAICKSVFATCVIPERTAGDVVGENGEVYPDE